MIKAGSEQMFGTPACIHTIISLGKIKFDYMFLIGIYYG
jgi:hypothetical protein